MKRSYIHPVFIVVTLFMGRGSWASEAPVQFVRDVAPILEKNCLLCHKAGSESGLDLTNPRQLLEGHEWIVPQHPETSPLMDVVSAADGGTPQMPKDGQALSDTQVGILHSWIKQGAVWPENVTLPILWSLAPVRSDLVPPVSSDNELFAESSIDAFVSARLKDAGLNLSEGASRRVLIRRLSYDLLGLPPTPDEIDAFESDTRPDAWGRLVDRILASPNYGERWGQHWLDVVRFSESNGFEDDAPRPHAWPYRDYVIRSLNSDKPYDQFVREQIAGDALRRQRVSRDSMIATSMLVLGPFDHAAAVSASKTEQLRAREVMLEELVTTVSQTFLGLTVNCARCHDHKFDPILQTDYYRIKAVFEGVHQADKSAFTAKQIIAPHEQLEWQFHQQEVQRAEASLSRMRDRLDAVNDVKNLIPLNDSVALWQFDGVGTKNGADWEQDRRGGQSPIQRKWTALFGAPPATKIAAVNSDQKVLDSGRGTVLRNEVGGAGYAIIPSIDGTELMPPVGPMSIFARVRYTGAFAGTEDVFRIGNRGDQHRDSIGFEIIAETGRQDAPDQQKSKLARARFVVTGTEQPREVGVQSTGVLQLDRWYDLVGVFAPLEDGTGRITLAVRDTNSGKQIGETVTQNVQFGSLSSAPSQNLLFFVAPSFNNGAQPNAQMDIAAVWHRELSRDEVEWLSATERDAIPHTGPQRRQIISLLEREIQNKKADIQKLHKKFETPPHALIGIRKTPVETVLFERGDVTQPRESVLAGGLSAIKTLPAKFELFSGNPEEERRQALANWLTDARNPLTARVIVNRVWHHHFRTGIVDTPSDFGVNGGRPSHPELLDYLTARFVHGDQWSIKKLHRRILLSATWRQSSTYDAESAKRDGGNRLLWRYPPRRLDAESVRDSMLAISGQLNRGLGGPSFQPFTTTRFNTTFYHLFDNGEPQYNRRTVYRMNVNTGRDPLLDALDCPAPSVLTPRRQQTITPLQALGLMNDTFVLRQAAMLAVEIQVADQDEASHIRQAWQRTLGRFPTDDELKSARQLLADSNLETLCWVLFNTSEFLQIR